MLMVYTSLFALSFFWSSVSLPPSYEPSVYLGGDVMLSRGVGAQFKKHGFDSLTGSYHPFKSATKKDITLLNLESPFSLPDKDRDEATFIFGANPRSIKVLDWLRGESTMIVSLANNHSMNRGFAGLRQTLKTLESASIRQIGLGKGERQKFISLERSGEKYCFGAYSYDGRSYWDKASQIMWYMNKLSQSRADLESMKQENCDYKIFVMHWGREYKVAPTRSQRKLAHNLIDAGATLIVGSHSHIFGEIEQYKSKYIFYSLGNFLFDQHWGAKGCQPGMDCISDPKTNKQVVPTHIGSAIRLDFPFDSYKKWHWYIGKEGFEKIQ
ncbi:hypothetical protein CSB09_00925 [Candidatus Gracilibacteria bacterium]|nr:MAG: hypothetical protein CSB09_00925 [Candidatus Gracilibacteria bacterium]